MTITISSKNSEKIFQNKQIISISSKQESDFYFNAGFEFILTLQYDASSNTCVLLNPYNNKSFLFKGVPIGPRISVDKVCKIMIDGSDEFITIKISDKEQNTATNTDNSIDRKKNDIEKRRVAIIQEVSSTINELKHKISMNSKGGILLHIGLILASIICAFGVSNYLTGLKISQSSGVLQMPVNIKLIMVYSVIIYAIGLMMKQGAYLYLQNKIGERTPTSGVEEKFAIILSSFFYVAVYFINVLYYITMSVFAVLMPIFFVGTAIVLALGCGQLKSSNKEARKELDKYEYRPDFELVIKDYRTWIDKYLNSLSESKINKVKDKLFNLQIKSAGEIIIGIITAPFLAYGVSNTLASCFPEAAGWIRISGLRFSPIFLVLATFLIIFAFFSFVNGFNANKKIHASNVLKQDGFSNYLHHGTEIFGLEGVKKIDSEMRRSFIIAICIIFIEFSMNVSYFIQEIGEDLNGMLLSAVAALVPTALLIAETFMLSQTRFETYACEDLLSKLD
ncbi:hypothetical protein J6G99_08205 [bacterium]|nr:hypothetical protein [bacterium]